MIARLILGLTMTVSALLIGSSALAGGWASVRMADEQTTPVAGERWQAILVVKQHDTYEVDVEELAVHFVHPATGTAFDVSGAPTGETGHYAIDAIFAETGLWNWTATPAPFASTNLPSLDVVDNSGAIDAGLPIVRFVTGTCAAPGDSFGTLELTRAPSPNVSNLATGITPDLAYVKKYIEGGPVAITVRPATDSGRLLACGEIPNAPVTAPIIVHLEPAGADQWLGSLSLIPSGGDLTASLTVVAQPASTGVTIRITEMSSGAFDPGEITIPAGTTVTWINDATMAHTITGAGGGFRNSGMLDPGASFSQTFAEPGVYSYVCDPHPWMTGVITVVG